MTISGGSIINSNDVLAAMKYPDKSSRDPSNSEKEIYTVNALGERLSFEDRNGSIHPYSFDVVGRPTADAVTMLGSGAIRRLETAYGTGGRPQRFPTFRSFTHPGKLHGTYREYRS